MLFKNYKKFRKTLHSDYDLLFQSYPFSRLVLDYLSQLWVHKRKPNSWVAEIDFIKAVENNVSTGLISFIYRLFLQIASLFIQFIGPKNGIHISVSRDRFPGLEECCEEIAVLSGRRLYKQGEFIKYLIGYLTLARLKPYRFFVGTRTAKLLRLFLVPDEESFKNLLSNNKLMSLLEKSVKSDVERTSKFIKRLGISVFLNTGDSSASARILNVAAQNNGLKVISFAHGYISADTLIGVAPIYCNHLVVWTELQQEDIRKALSYQYNDKIVYIGFPKFFKNDNRYKHCRKALLVFSRLNKILIDRKKIKVIKDLIDLLVLENFSVTIRLHPNEKNRFSRIEKFLENSNLFVSYCGLQEDLTNASLVIGAQSSVLVEAVHSDTPTFELEELCLTSNRLEMVTNVNFMKLKTLIEEDDFLRFKKNNLLNRKKFINKLSQLMVLT